MWWKHTPAVPAALGLLTGCASAAVFPVLPANQLLWGLGWLGAALFALERRSLGLMCLGLALGWGLGGGEQRMRWAWRSEIDLARPVVLEGQVRSHGLEDEDGWRCLLVTRWVEQDGRRRSMSEEVWLRLPRDRPAVFGEHLQIKGYLRRGVQPANGVETLPRPWSFRVESERLLISSRPGAFPWRWADGARHWAEGTIHRLDQSHGLGPWGAAWLRALVLGDRQSVPLHQLQSVRRLGLAHLLAVSGLHLAMVLGGFWVFTSPLPWRWRVGMGLVVTVAYGAVVGLKASLMRAAVMAWIALLAWVAERPPQARNALALAVCILLILEPGWVHDLGFCLSVAATAGILWWAPAWVDSAEMPWRRLPRPLRASLAATLAAQTATLPWMLTLHGGVQPLSIVLNLMALPWLAAFLSCGIASMALAASPWTLPMAGPLARAVDWLSRLAAWVCDLPPSLWHWQPWPAWGWAVLALAGGWGLRVWASSLKAPLGGWLRAAPLVLLAGALAGGPHTLQSSAVPELLMLDVGQGDALVLRDGDEALMVDGGGWRRGDAGGRILWPVMASLGLPKLRGVLVTHGDTDHCAGIRDLLRYLPVEEVWMPPGAALDKDCPLRVLEAPGVSWRPVWQGDRMRLGRWQLRVLSPQAAEQGSGNDRSLVVEASVHGRRVLLTGDIEAATERRLERRLDPSSPYDVLKVAHHGSKTSTGRSFLARVQPKLALISAGPDNPYGHPTGNVLERLHRSGAVVLRTDRSGLVRLRIPAEGPWEISTPGLPRGDLPLSPR